MNTELNESVSVVPAVPAVASLAVAASSMRAIRKIMQTIPDEPIQYNKFIAKNAPKLTYDPSFNRKDFICRESYYIAFINRCEYYKNHLEQIEKPLYDFLDIDLEFYIQDIQDAHLKYTQLLINLRLSDGQYGDSL